MARRASNWVRPHNCQTPNPNKASSAVRPSAAITKTAVGVPRRPSRRISSNVCRLGSDDPGSWRINEGMREGSSLRGGRGPGLSATAPTLDASLGEVGRIEQAVKLTRGEAGHLLGHLFDSAP